MVPFLREVHFEVHIEFLSMGKTRPSKFNFDEILVHSRPKFAGKEQRVKITYKKRETA